MRFLNLNLLFLALILTGCQIKRIDVSDNAKYVSLVNTRYLLNNDMQLYGINLPPGYGDEINVFVILPMGPGPSGPEVISKETLVSKNELKIISVIESVNHLPGFKEIEAIVEVHPFKKTVDVPVVIDLKYLLDTNIITPLNPRPDS